jgi:hypothetical protein
MSIFLSVALLHAINPDATIMRTNLERLAEGKNFDIDYIEQLSADMIPTVAQRLPDVYNNEQNRGFSCSLSPLLTQAAATAHNDNNNGWLAWHWARYRSEQAMGKMENIGCSIQH